MDSEETDSSQEEVENEDSESADESSALDANSLKSAENFASSSSCRSMSCSQREEDGDEEWAGENYTQDEGQETESQHLPEVVRTTSKHSHAKRHSLENHNQESSINETKTSEEKDSHETKEFESSYKRRKGEYSGDSLFRNCANSAADIFQKSQDIDVVMNETEDLTDNEYQVAYSRESVVAALARLRLENAKLEQELSKTKVVTSEQQEKEKELEKWAAEKERLKKEMVEEHKRYERMASYAKSLEGRYRQLRDQKEHLKGNRTSLTKQHETDQEETRRLEMENRALRCAVQMGKECLREESEHGTKLRRAARKQRQSVVLLKDKKAQLEMRLERLQAEMTDDQREKSAIETQLEDKRRRLHEQAELIQGQREELAKCFKTIRCLEKEIRYLRGNEGDVLMTRFVQKQCEEELDERTEEVRSLKSMVIEKDRRITGLLYLLSKNNNGACISRQKNKEGVDTDDEKDLARFLKESDEREKKAKEKKERKADKKEKEKREDKKEKERKERSSSQRTSDFPREHKADCGCCICLRNTHRRMKDCYKDWCTEEPGPSGSQASKDKDLIVKRLCELEEKVEGNARKISRKIESLKTQTGDYADPRPKADERDKQVLKFLSDLDAKVEANARRISTKIETLKRGKEMSDERLFVDNIRLHSSPPTTYSDPKTTAYNKKINDHIFKLINELDGKVETNARQLSQKIEEISQESGTHNQFVPRYKEKASREPKDGDKADQSVLKLLNDMDEKFETNIRRISEKLEALRDHDKDIRRPPEASFGRGFQADFVDRRPNDYTLGRSREGLVQRLMANSKQQQEILATLSESIDRNAREVCSMVGGLGSHAPFPQASQFFHNEDCSIHEKLRVMIEENQERSSRTKSVFQSLMKHSAMERALLEQASVKLGQPMLSSPRVVRKAGGKGRQKKHKDKRERLEIKRRKNDGLERMLVHKIRQEFGEKLDEEANRLEMKIERIHHDLRRAKGQPFTEVIVDDGSRMFEANHYPANGRGSETPLQHKVEDQTKELLQEIKEIRRERLNSQFSDLSHHSGEDELIVKVGEKVKEKAQALEVKIQRILEFLKQEKERKLIKKKKRMLSKGRHRKSSDSEKGKRARTLAEKIRIAKKKLKESEMRLSISSVDTAIQESLDKMIAGPLPRDVKVQASQRPAVAAVAQGPRRQSLVINAPEPSGARLKRRPPNPRKRSKRPGRKPKPSQLARRLKASKPKKNLVETESKSDGKQTSSSSLTMGPAKAQTNESAESVQHSVAEDPLKSEEISAEEHATDDPEEPERRQKTAEEKGQQTSSLNDEMITEVFTRQGAEFNAKMMNLGAKLDHVLEEMGNRHLWARSSEHMKPQSSDFLTEQNEFFNDHLQRLREQLDRVLQELAQRERPLSQTKLSTVDACAQASGLDALLFEMRCVQRHLQRQSVLVVAQRALLKRTAGKKKRSGNHRVRKVYWRRLRRLNRQMAREQLKINVMVRKIEEDMEQDPTSRRHKKEKGDVELRHLSSGHKKKGKGEITTKVKSTVGYQKKASKKKKREQKVNRNVSNQQEQEIANSESTETTGACSSVSREITVEVSQSQMQDYEGMIGDAICQMRKMFMKLSHTNQAAEDDPSEAKSSGDTGSSGTVNWCTEGKENHTKTILQSEYCVNENESKVEYQSMIHEDGKSPDRFDKHLSSTDEDSHKSIPCQTLVHSQARHTDGSLARIFIENLFSSRAQSDDEGSEEKVPIKIFLDREVSASLSNLSSAPQARAFIQSLFYSVDSDRHSESKTSGDGSEGSTDKHKQQADTPHTESESRTDDKVTSPIETSLQRSESYENSHNKTSSGEMEENQNALQVSRTGSSCTSAAERTSSSQTTSTRGLSSSDSSPRTHATPNNRSFTTVSRAESQAQASSFEKTRSSSDEHNSAAERSPQNTDSVTRSLQIWPKHFNASTSVSSTSTPKPALQRGTDSPLERYSSYSSTDVASRTDSARSRITKHYLPPALFQRSSSATSQDSDRKVAHFLEKYLFSDSGSDQRDQQSHGTQFSRSDCARGRVKSSSCSSNSQDPAHDGRRSTSQDGAMPSRSDSPWECEVETH